MNLPRLNKKLGPFRFKNIGTRCLLTNDSGDYLFLKKPDFNRLIEGTLDKSSLLYNRLIDLGFLLDEQKKFSLIERYRKKNSFIWHGPSLHIVVVTLRCNHSCIYCQTSARPLSAINYDMSKSIAKRAIDIIFESPSKAITIELQGGEPLVNWEVIKFICNYAFQKNKKFSKTLKISLVSNLSLLTNEKLKFLISHNVSICTSLDGPKKLHDLNRMFINGESSYDMTVGKITLIKNKMKDARNLSALLTLSRSSLSYPEEIINEYIKWGFEQIHLRPVSYLGASITNKDKIGFGVNEFSNFYKRAIDYLVFLNNTGKTSMSERTAKVFLTKVLLKYDPNFLDLRSPCGAGIGQMVYNYNGKIFTCDEARMLGDDTFLIGDVKSDSYKDIINSSNVSSSCIASLQENLYCDYCVFKGFCGVCPVINYAEFGNLFPQLPNSRLCKINKTIFEFLFQKLEKKGYKEVFKKWVSAV